MLATPSPASNELVLAGDSVFHQRIAEASNNSALVLVVRTLWEQRMGPLFMRFENHFTRPETWTTVNAEHEAVFDAILRRDPREARNAMRRHMDNAARRFNEGFRTSAAPARVRSKAAGRPDDRHHAHHGSHDGTGRRGRTRPERCRRVRGPRPRRRPVGLRFRGLGVVRLLILALVIFYQFFTRYALNDSASWTEEIARYLLICVTWVGAAIATRKNNHVQVDFFYRLLPARLMRVMSTLVDAVRIAFLGYACVLTVKLMEKIGGQPMAIIDWPIGLVYGVVLFGFALMTFAVQRS